GWLFTDAEVRRRFHSPEDGWRDVRVSAGSFAFKLLGRTLVVDRNASRGDTLGPKGDRPVKCHGLHAAGRKIDVEGELLAGEHAQAVRAGEVKQLTVTLA